jgi:calcineurin-like phosphoesterase family protein
MSSRPSLATSRRRFFTSDLHFGHGNIIGYCRRPFTGVREMNDWLVRSWNDTVGPEDEVWVLGDLALGNITWSLSRVAELNGTIVLVAGNHDRPFRRIGETRPDWEERYLAAGIAEIRHGEVRLDLDGVDVLVSHFPYSGDSGGEDRFSEHRPKDRGGWLLHGHVHDVWRQRGRMINVGVDAWAGTPVHARVLAELAAAGEADLTPLAWTR